MRFRKSITEGSAIVFLVWGAACAQNNPANQTSPGTSSSTQSPTTQAPAAPASPTTTQNPGVSSSSATGTEGATTATTEKPKHWSGSLVDATCLAKALGSGPASTQPGASGAAGAGPASGSSAGVEKPHFTSENPDQLQQSAQPGGGVQPQGGSPAGAPKNEGPTGTTPTYPGQESGQNPDMNQAQTARAAAAQRVDTAAKQCTASSATQEFGLATSGGDVVRFDKDGNTKATDALRAVDVQPGKKVKAKVTGVMEENNLVRVASVEVKGKKISPSSSMGGQGGEVK